MNLYWITRLSALNELLGALVFLSIIAIVGLTIYFVSESDSYHDDTSKLNMSRAKKTVACSIIPIILVIALVLLPTTKEMAFIIVGEKVLKSEQIKNTTKDILDLNDVAINYLKNKFKEESN